MEGACASLRRRNLRRGKPQRESRLRRHSPGRRRCRWRHGRFDYSPIVDRPVLRWPNGARVAVWLIPNIEHFLFDRPGTPLSRRALRSPGHSQLFLARLRRAGRHLADDGDHGALRHPRHRRAQLRRLQRVPAHHRGEGKKLDWEWMGHGTTNSIMLNGQSEAAERAIITEVVATITANVGKAPRGWLSPAMSETVHTLDILAESGIDYVGNWGQRRAAVPDEGQAPARCSQFPIRRRSTTFRAAARAASESGAVRADDLRSV